MSFYTYTEWQALKNEAADQARLLSANPLLPSDYKADQIAHLSLLEVAATYAMHLIATGTSLSDTREMIAQFWIWKTGGVL